MMMAIKDYSDVGHYKFGDKENASEMEY